MSLFRSLRARLTALATGTTFAVSALLCLVLYFGMRYSLYREIDAFLAGEVMEFRTILADAGADLREAQGRIRSELGSRKRGDLNFRLLDADGRVLLSSESTNALPSPWPLPSQRPAEQECHFQTERHAPDGHPIRTASQWVSDAGGNRIVQAAYLLDQVHASLWRFRNTSIAALVLATILAAIAGRFLARQGLRPVGRMAEAAHRITVENLSDRLERSGSGDELDHLAETFNDMLARLEGQIAQIKQFTADAAHELRTPLAALRGNAEVALSSRRSAEELRAVLADSIEEYDRLARLASDLLFLAWADAGQQILRRARFRLDLSAADVTDLFRALAEERGVTLSLATDSPVWLDGDDGRLRQVIGNLIDNALKCTRTGGQVNVSLRRPNGMIELAVQDTGSGIPAEHLKRVFDRFYRVDAARSPGGGAGLGLPICRTIVEAHQGEICIRSEPGDGTTAIVRLPASDDSSAV